MCALARNDRGASRGRPRPGRPALRSEPAAQTAGLLQRRVRRVLPGGRDAAHEDGPGEPRPLEAGDPALQTADGPLRDEGLVLGGGGLDLALAGGADSVVDGVYKVGGIGANGKAAVCIGFIVLLVISLMNCSMLKKEAK